MLCLSYIAVYLLTTGEGMWFTIPYLSRFIRPTTDVKRKNGYEAQ